MNVWIVLLRGIYVGGKNLLPMQALRATLESTGFAQVRTYIQSGNCVLSAPADDNRVVADQIKTLIDQRFGISLPVLVVSMAEFEWDASRVSVQNYSMSASHPLKGLDIAGGTRPCPGAIDRRFAKSVDRECSSRVFIRTQHSRSPGSLGFVSI